MVLLRQIVALFALAGAVIASASAAIADDYPSRPVKIIVPFGAGGPTDVYTRAIAEELRKSLHQPFVMENRPGAGTTIGTEVVAKSAPDGYTLLMVSGTQTVNETLYSHKQYQLMRDLVPIAPLIDTDLVHVPYKGSTGARNDILSGQVQILFDSVPTMAPMIKAGMVRALGTTGKTRSSTLPDVPTIEEAGVPGFNATLWVGFMAPAQTPQPIVERLSQAITKILARPDIKEAWEKTGATPIVMTQPEFKAFMDAQVAKWANVIKANNIPPIN